MFKKAILLSCLTVALMMPCTALAWQQNLLTEVLGGLLFADRNLSINQNQSCMSCHHPSAAFADPDNKADPSDSPVSEGSIPGLFGGRNAPSAAYAGFSPVFFFDGAEGLYIGGSFWDGRATGQTLGDPLAEQALGPFLNPVEMALPNSTEVVDRVLSSAYAPLFVRVCGNPATPEQYGMAYNCIGTSIAAFERTQLVERFNSKFDRFWAEQGKDLSTFGVNVLADGTSEYVGPPAGFRSRFFSFQEAKGLALFNATNKGNCAACHLTTNYIDTAGKVLPPMLTDFTYDNLGIPVNPRIAQLAGPQAIDYGLGARTDILTNSEPAVPLAKWADPNNTETVEVVASEAGKFKVPTLRNVGRTAPYGHNGFFATLNAITSFYNTRDVPSMNWPAAEVPDTVNKDELGNLGLTSNEEQAIVAFMKTLTD